MESQPQQRGFANVISKIEDWDLPSGGVLKEWDCLWKSASNLTNKMSFNLAGILLRKPQLGSCGIDCDTSKNPI